MDFGRVCRLNIYNQIISFIPLVFHYYGYCGWLLKAPKIMGSDSPCPTFWSIIYSQNGQKRDHVQGAEVLKGQWTKIWDWFEGAPFEKKCNNLVDLSSIVYVLSYTLSCDLPWDWDVPYLLGLTIRDVCSSLLRDVGFQIATFAWKKRVPLFVFEMHNWVPWGELKKWVSYCTTNT